MGGVLGQFGLRAIPFGIAAMVLGFILKSAGTQAERLEGSGASTRRARNRSRALSSMRARHLCSLFPRNARRPASVIRTRATLIDLPQLFLEGCGGFLF